MTTSQVRKSLALSLSMALALTNSLQLLASAERPSTTAHLNAWRVSVNVDGELTPVPPGIPLATPARAAGTQELADVRAKLREWERIIRANEGLVESFLTDTQQQRLDRALRRLSYVTATSRQERHAAARGLPVEIRHVQATDGWYRDFVVDGVVQIRVSTGKREWVMPSQVAAASTPAEEQPDGSTSMPKDDPEATEEEIEDALIVLADMENESANAEPDCYELEAYCNNNNDCQGQEVAQVSGPSAGCEDYNCFFSALGAIWGFISAMGRRYQALLAIQSHMLRIAILSTGALTWQVTVAVGATLGAIGAIGIGIYCIFSIVPAMEKPRNYLVSARSARLGMVAQ